MIISGLVVTISLVIKREKNKLGKDIKKMLKKPTLGILDLNDEREFALENTFKEAQQLKENLLNTLRNTGKIDIVDPSISFKGFDKMVWQPWIVKKQTSILLNADIDGVIFHYSVWASPRLARMAAKILIRENKKKSRTTPILVLTNLAPEQPGMVGGMAASGGLDQLGIANFRIWSKDISKDTEKLAQIISFAKFAYDRTQASASADEVIEKLHGQIYGEVGGRSIQIVTAEADPLQWSKIFGIDTQPIGQMEIVRKANEMISWSDGINSKIVKIKDERVLKAFNFLVEHVASINYQGNFTEDKLKYQIACYYATQDIIKENNLDFIGIKCQPEMSSYHVTQCLTQAFSNDRRGPGGEKKKIVACACEDDKDGALTQQIMHLLTGKPTLFADFRHIDPEKNIIYLVNCGAHTPWFATGTDNTEDNLSKIKLEGQTFFYPASGATVNFDAAPGPVTGARLGRKNGKYWMNIVPGEFVERPSDAVITTPGWPNAFMRPRVPIEELFSEHPCNHMQIVAGDCIAGLVELCEKLDIGYILQDAKLKYEKTI